MRKEVFQYLRIDPKLIPAIKEGEKKMTIRYGLRELVLGEAVMEATDGSEKLDIFIEGVRLYTLKDVPDSIAQEDGFDDAEALFEGLKEYYSKIERDNFVTVIRFCV